jgi:hypothetical protein
VTNASKIMGQKDFREFLPAYKRDNTIKQLQKASTKNNFFTDKSLQFLDLVQSLNPELDSDFVKSNRNSQRRLTL